MKEAKHKENMTIIYMESTLNLMSQIEGVEVVNNLVKAGKVKETEDKVQYLVIYDSLL